MTAIVWFRRDLRLLDNPAWSAATARHDAVTALFVVEPGLWSAAAPLRRSLLRAHLEALDTALAARGGRLLVRHGDAREVVPAESRRLGAAAVYVNDDHSPYSIARDAAVAQIVPVEFLPGLTLHGPDAVKTAAGAPPRVFTPYFKRWVDLPWALWPEAGDAAIGDDPGESLPAEAPPVMAGGEEAAHSRLADFIGRVDRYAEDRDRPDLDGTSGLSADLHFGTLDARRIRAEIGDATPGRAAFVRQLCWRDFYMQVLRHHPNSVGESLRPEYAAVAWRNDPDELDAWRSGLTGYPIVDAGMRQLATEGFVHNRVRMIVASFLVKDLLVDWRHGERWFRRHLVDGDVAQNVGNWQWVAGTGTDAAPYFRVFNPVTQSRKFDPRGAYIRRYVPELASLDDRDIHAPWEAGPLELAAAGVALGDTYPPPIVDHKSARQRALDAYAVAKTGAA